jgi:hypothetical protein
VNIFLAIAAALGIAIVALIVLRIAISIADAFFWPLVLIGLGVAIGFWWVNRRKSTA